MSPGLGSVVGTGRPLLLLSEAVLPKTDLYSIEDRGRDTSNYMDA